MHAEKYANEAQTSLKQYRRVTDRGMDRQYNTISEFAPL